MPYILQKYDSNDIKDILGIIDDTLEKNIIDALTLEFIRKLDFRATFQTITDCNGLHLYSFEMNKIKIYRLESEDQSPTFISSLIFGYPKSISKKSIDFNLIHYMLIPADYVLRYEYPDLKWSLLFPVEKTIPINTFFSQLAFGYDITHKDSLWKEDFTENFRI